MTDNTQNATLGRTVHVIELDSPVGAPRLVVRAAVVSGLNDDGTVNLSVFRPSGVAYVRSVAHQEPVRDGNGYLQPALVAQQPDTWHWPALVLAPAAGVGAGAPLAPGSALSTANRDSKPIAAVPADVIPGQSQVGSQPSTSYTEGAPVPATHGVVRGDQPLDGVLGAGPTDR
jgi:hypothetical protein